MRKETRSARVLIPVIVATVVTLALYSRQALLLLTKVGEVINGVFDTSVPAFPLAGLFFVLLFVFLRRGDLESKLMDDSKDLVVSAAAASLALLPLVVLLLFRSALGGSYAFAAVALTTSWVGVTAAFRPSAFRFLLPYLLIYVIAIGSVSVLTSAAGDPLAVVIAWVGSVLTWLFRMPVEWSSVYIAFTAAGGSRVNLFISQECSGMASISIFFLLIGLMHIDLGASRRATLQVAVWGSLLFIFLNSLRVVVLIAGGIYGGMDLLENLHGWVGYAFYVLGYGAVLFVYLRSARLEPYAHNLGVDAKVPEAAQRP